MADPKLYNEEKDKRSPGLFRPELGGFKPGSKGTKGLFDSETSPPCEPDRLVAFSRSCSTAESPTRFSSIVRVPSNPVSPSVKSMVLGKFVGRRELFGLYTEVGFFTGGGMEMLALPVLPPTVPTSANRPFRLGRAALLGAESRECEGTRPVDAREGAGLEESTEEGGVDPSVLLSCVSASRDPVAEKRLEASLPLLVVRDKGAIDSHCPTVLTNTSQCRQSVKTLHGWSGYRES